MTTIEQGREFRAPAEFLHMRNVDVARGEKVVLHEVNLRIATREHVAILGPNGCGKSTLIKAMTCECYPIVRDGMEMNVYGRDRWDVQELRKHLGVVATELPGERTSVTRGLDAVVSGFFSSSTLWPNLVVTEQMRSSAMDALAMLGAEYLRDRWVGEMSAGEKRRIVIALVESLADPCGNLPHLRLLHAAGGQCGRAHANARRLERRIRIVWN